MKTIRHATLKTGESKPLSSELLILPDGRVLAQNLTPAMARLLSELNPDDKGMRRRAGGRRLARSVSSIRHRSQAP